MIDFRLAHYILSAPDYSFRPKDQKPEVVMLGKSNVGKSTLINLLTGQKLAYSSKSAGKTKLLNYFLIDDSFYLVDSPGYGYTAYGGKEDENFAAMMEGYFKNPLLEGAVVLLDIRRLAHEEDLSMISYLKEEGVPFLVVYTKSDKANQSIKAKARKEALNLGAKEVLYTGLKEGRDALRNAILHLL